jgi:hypothetical protein
MWVDRKTTLSSSRNATFMMCHKDQLRGEYKAQSTSSDEEVLCVARTA